MELIFLSHRIPYPPNKGDKIRAHAILNHLAARHIIHLACFVDDPADFVHAETLRRLVKGDCLFVPLVPRLALGRGLLRLASNEPITSGYFGSRKIHAWVRTILKTRPVNRSVVFSAAMAPYVLCRPGIDLAHSVLDLVDVDSDKWRQYASKTAWPTNWIYRREAKTLLKLERKAAAAFGATLLVSRHEAETFSNLAPESTQRIHPISNGVDFARFAPQLAFSNPFKDDEQPIVMTGSMDYWPNVEGARWFVQEILPRVLVQLPRVRFYIVGNNPVASLKELQSSRVVVTGRVADIRPYIAHASVAVAPVRIARGVQNKVLEALAMQKPVVATREATRALDVASGNELWIENDPGRFASAVVGAIEGVDRLDVAANGRAYVERCHNWSKTLASLDRILEGLEAQRTTQLCPHTVDANSLDIRVPCAAGHQLGSAE